MNSFLYDKRITRTVSEINMLVYILNIIWCFDITIVYGKKGPAVLPNLLSPW